MVTIRKAKSGDIADFREVARVSISELCKEYYTPVQIEALLGQFPADEVYEKWLQERVLLVAEDKSMVAGFAQ